MYNFMFHNILTRFTNLWSLTGLKPFHNSSPTKLVKRPDRKKRSRTTFFQRAKIKKKNKQCLLNTNALTTAIFSKTVTKTFDPDLD